MAFDYDQTQPAITRDSSSAVPQGPQATSTVVFEALSTWAGIGDKPRLMSVAEPVDRSPYRGYRFPPEIIAHAVWLYFRFQSRVDIRVDGKTHFTKSWRAARPRLFD